MVFSLVDVRTLIDPKSVCIIRRMFIDSGRPPWLNVHLIAPMCTNDYYIKHRDE